LQRIAGILLNAGSANGLVSKTIDATNDTDSRSRRASDAWVEPDQETLCHVEENLITLCWTGSDRHAGRAPASSTGTQRESGLVHRFPSRGAADSRIPSVDSPGMQPQMTLAAWSSSRKRPSCFSRTGPSLPAQKQKRAMLSYAKTKGGAPLPGREFRHSGHHAASTMGDNGRRNRIIPEPPYGQQQQRGEA
jgi:hypothetical protein